MKKGELEEWERGCAAASERSEFERPSIHPSNMSPTTDILGS
jgi:hypothetical protein